MFYTYEEYKRLSNETYENKLIWTRQIIAYAIKQNKDFVVSLSWGKDSVVMSHLIYSICKKGHYVFANTMCEYPETYKYRDYMLNNSFFKDVDYHETKPIKTFFECVKEYGYPSLRENTGQGNKRMPKCCNYLKEIPLNKKKKELMTDLVFMGLQATESMNRRLLFMRLGGYYYAKSRKENVCIPMAIWNNDDIFRYAKENNVELNPLYKKMKRTGCMFCTGFKSWKEVMCKYDKSIYEKVLLNVNKQSIIKECY